MSGVILCGLGGARATRADSGAFAGIFSNQDLFGEAPKSAREGACAPQKK